MPTRYRLNRQPHNGRPPWQDADGLGGQVAVIHDALGHAITTGAFGRSAGKSATPVFLFLVEGAADRPETEHIAGQVYSFAYGSPQFKITKPVYRAWKRTFSNLITKHYDADLILRWRSWGNNNGAEQHFWSLDKYESSRSFRLHRWIVDEFKDVHEHAVTRVLIPTGLARQGKGLLIGTPSRIGIGSAMARRYFDMGKDPLFPAFASRGAPTHCNPHLSAEEIQRAIDALQGDEDAIREEIWAEFLSTEGAVFGNLDAAFTLAPEVEGRIDVHGSQVTFDTDSRYPNLWIHQLPRSDHTYSGGLDLAEVGDSTVLHLFVDSSKRHALCLRLSRMPYPKQAMILAHILRMYGKPRVLMDGTGGHGGHVREVLAKEFEEGVASRVWNSTSKEEDISRLASLIQNVGLPEAFGPRVMFMALPWLKAEFREFEARFEDRTGRRLSRVRYGAPPNRHDDGVAAAAIASSLLVAPVLRKPTGPLVTVGTMEMFRQAGRRRVAY